MARGSGKAVRIVQGMGLAAALAAGAAGAAERTDAQLAAWLAENTDLSAQQVVLVTPDLVYSLEPLGSRSPTDEVLALVRTEAFDGDWGARNGVQSWEAHLLFDCKLARVRVVRSASYPDRNRKGQPRPAVEPGDWLSPTPDNPAARLLAAACEPNFSWPLRTHAEAAPPPRAPAAEPQPPPVVETARKTPAPASVPATSQPVAGFSIQIGRGPSAEGAKKALADTRRILGPMGAALVASTETSQVGERRRYTAVLSGFPTADAAEAACDKLHDAGHHCFRRAGAGRGVDVAEQQPAEPQPAAAPPPASGAPAPREGYVVQLAYGRSEAGAGEAIERARKALGPEAAHLVAATEKSQVGSRTRFTAMLGGFETAAAAVRACEALQKAQQSCFARPAAPAPAAKAG